VTASELPDFRLSPYLQFDAGNALPGDPATAELFTSALDFLEEYTATFEASASWVDKTAAQLLKALYKYNAASQGEALTLHHLQALSRRRLLAFEETGWNLTHYEHIVRFVGSLIDLAVAAEEQHKLPPQPLSAAKLPGHILDIITAYFIEDGLVFEKTADDLHHELCMRNDWYFEDYPALAYIQVTLLQLLQASTARLASGEASPEHTHIHHLIEEAFLQQELLHAIHSLWPQTQSTDVTLAHLALMETAVSSHVSHYGTELLQAFSERVRQRNENNTPSSLPR